MCLYICALEEEWLLLCISILGQDYQQQSVEEKKKEERQMLGIESEQILNCHPLCCAILSRTV